MAFGDSLRSDLFARADALMQNAPGQVSVARISHIDDVQVLRAARAQLTTDESAELRTMRLQIMERLDGAQAVATPPKPQKQGLLGKLFATLNGAADKMQSQGQLAHLANKGDQATRLPAPFELLDAFESWAIAHLVAGRIDDDLTVLRRPLDEAMIEPIAQ